MLNLEGCGGILSPSYSPDKCHPPAVLSRYLLAAWAKKLKAHKSRWMEGREDRGKWPKEGKDKTPAPELLALP